MMLGQSLNSSLPQFPVGYKFNGLSTGGWLWQVKEMI